ncbi:MAG: hypothetical protein KatS3mg005_3559 [Bryobacteraceae bacterium]|nr:MAG: hypothetical protein KatS3mg005_3559 [Bryobacteraceae bacterium]
MQPTMRRLFPVFACCVFVVFGQETAQRAPGRPPLPSFPGEGAEAARGIKMDIRAMLTYPEGVYSPADVQRMEAAVRKIVDEIASGAKLTKADAARQNQPASDHQTVFAQLEKALEGRSRVVFLGMAAAPSSAGNRPIACPPPGCGCDQQGHGVTCACGLLRNPGMEPYCLCALCYEAPKLPTLPDSDLRQAAPGASAAPKYLVVVATPPDAPAQVRQMLAENAVKTLQTEPWPAGVVIKQKSHETNSNGGVSSLVK